MPGPRQPLFHDGEAARSLTARAAMKSHHLSHASMLLVQLCVPREPPTDDTWEAADVPWPIREAAGRRGITC